MLRRSALLLAVFGCIGAVGLAGCGSKSSSSTAAPAVTPTPSASTPAPTTSFAKTKFVFHLGLAAGAFHRYIYKPFKAGVFGRPSSNKLALVKGAIAALFVYHELKLAASDVKSSKILRTLFAPITLLAHKFSALRAQFLGGKYVAADINAAEAAGNSIASTAAATGTRVTESIPTPSQLAAGIAQ
jgi:hypothetical protein